jgi:hypothetical protein
MHIVAMKIHHLPPLQIFDVNPVTALQHIETRRGQGLVEKISGVLLKPVARLRIQVLSGPGSPARRDVQVAFGFKMIKFWTFHLYQECLITGLLQGSVNRPSVYAIWVLRSTRIASKELCIRPDEGARPRVCRQTGRGP